MWLRPKARFDSACAISQGARDTQEDAVIVEFPVSSNTGFAIVADGMGGHSAGEIASRHLITQLYSALKFGAEQYESNHEALPALMFRGLEEANAAVRDHVRMNPRLHGMGSTLVALALVENRAHWLSVGDSPLYLFRDGTLRQLNQVHCFGTELDQMVKEGTMGVEEAQSHPDREALTSAVIGVPIPHVDRTNAGFYLRADDILIVASDGLQFLEDRRIERILRKHRRRGAAEIASYLMAAVDKLGDPDQDNVSLSVIKVNHVKAVKAAGKVVKPSFRSNRDETPENAAIAAQ